VGAQSVRRVRTDVGDPHIPAIRGIMSHEVEINRLEELINSATQNVSTDGLSTSFNLEEARKRLAELYRLQGSTNLVRPRVVRVRLGGDF
jgi:hypothetical protein